MYKPKDPSIYQGNQVIINSDRLLFNAKTDSILLFSNEAIGFSTNGSFHFDTSSDKNKSKFIINSPNIYLGLEYDNSLPTEPAVLGNELGEFLEELLDLLDDIINTIIFEVSYSVSSAPGVTGLNANNLSVFNSIKRAIKTKKSEIKSLKSQNIKLV